MKIRRDYVTNSSSSSFIIHNNSDESMTSEDVALSLISKILEDAKDRFCIGPGESLEIECGDHDYDGAFEMFIHDHAGGGCWTEDFGDGKVSVEFAKSYH